MKNIPLILLETALTTLLLGCVSAPVAFAPVGPNPAGPRNMSMSTLGQLEVFSALQAHRDGNEFDPNPAWYQHTDYTVYDSHGKRVEHVFNTIGHYEEAPSVVTLPAGKYRVTARARGYLMVNVPVIIERGRITRVHLDADWKQAANIPQTELVEAPGGYAVGWRVNQATRVE